MISDSYKQNLHTHTSFCDGKDTPRHVLEVAQRLGFNSIGFSEHSPAYYNSKNSGMKQEDMEEYISQISALKNEYSGKMDIFCGIEYDMYSGIDTSRFDYVIGALHFIKANDTYVAIARSAPIVKEAVDKHFEGNGMKLAKCYYEQLCDLPKYGKFDFVAHFDLVTRNNELLHLFDESSDEYMGYVLRAAEALRTHIPFFEINTGSMARGYRSVPYPNLAILKEMKRLGYGAVITSDCHNAERLECSFAEAAELLREAGFKEKYIFTDKGFVPVSL